MSPGTTRHGGAHRATLRAAGCWLLAGAAVWIAAHDAARRAQASQLPAISSQLRHARGQHVVPLYRGWFTGDDGRIYAAYEYLNLNADETLHIPVGPDNAIAPGPTDQGQPTWFRPGHQHGVFAVPLPAGSTTEITWTLSSRGQTLSMPSNLGPLYEIEGLVNHGGSFPGNTPPLVRLAPDGPAGRGPAGLTAALEATVGQAVPLDVRVTDDGLPPLADRTRVIRSLQRSYRRADGSATGLTVTWTRYRGIGAVGFRDAAPPVKHGRARTTATFDEPGNYMLRALVSDGSGFDGCCWTNAYVAVDVRPAPR